MSTWGRRRRVGGASRAHAREGGDHGAAAVEFALVVPLLIALLFGIIDYGMWFTDALSARQGVREAARQAVVEEFDPTGACIGSDLAKTACFTRSRTGAVGGTAYVKVRVIEPAGWAVGNQLQVCAIVLESGLTGLTPMPADAAVRTDVVMRIEQGDTARAAYADVLPAGITWGATCA